MTAVGWVWEMLAESSRRRLGLPDGEYEFSIYQWMFFYESFF
jgi:hypothetical protein